MGLVIFLSLAGTASAQAPAQPNIHKARAAVHKDIPVMMLAMPGRGILLSAPGEITTITIESNNGVDCGSYLARTDDAGLLEVPVARTPNCPSPRIVIHR
ncbi:MAG: hypothetical protein COA84_11310 [Robiginitomaculum sp.]|nr:MAG: hypothetical protein COA84_11310 [Robiginitomaculum sp.]